ELVGLVRSQAPAAHARTAAQHGKRLLTAFTRRDGIALPDRAAVNARLIQLIRAAAIALGIFLSGFVLHEPAPYELYMVALIPIWALFGLRISRHVAPLLVLLVLFNIGGLVSMSLLPELGSIPLYLAVSMFLAFTAVFC